MLRICLPPKETGKLPPMREFRNIDKTMIKTEFMEEQAGGGGYENFHLR